MNVTNKITHEGLELKEANKKINALWDSLISNGIFIPPKANSLSEALELIQALLIICNHKLKATSSIKSFGSRHQQWVTASFKSVNMSGIGDTVYIIQQLGMIDCHLIANEHQNFLDNEEVSLGFNCHLTVSYLWVLGAYEIIRKLHGKVKGNDAFKNEFKLLKDKIARLRMPLAKLEPMDKYKKTDYPIAWPGIQTQFGVCWQISEIFIPGQMCAGDKAGIISRRELADEFLRLINKIEPQNFS